MSKLMNFYKNSIAYAALFLEPVDPERDNVPEYFQIVRYPNDFTQIDNRLFNGFYKDPQSFWIDLGFVFKNCQLFNSDKDSDIRIMCDTLRQVAINLYRQWYHQEQDFQLKGKFHFRWVQSEVKNLDTTSPEFVEEDLDCDEFDAEEELENDL